jgi:hypothetical protein
MKYTKSTLALLSLTSLTGAGVGVGMGSWLAMTLDLAEHKTKISDNTK